MQFFHLELVLGLRKTYASLSADASYEDILRAVEVTTELEAAMPLTGSVAGEPLVTLVRQPQVFTLAVVR